MGRGPSSRLIEFPCEASWRLDELLQKEECVIIRTERRPIGKNDFGAPEDQIADIAIPHVVPDGIVMIFRNVKTDDVIDSNGMVLLSELPYKAIDRDCHRGQIELYLCFGKAP
jgi:hypothetical protein